MDLGTVAIHRLWTTTRPGGGHAASSTGYASVPTAIDLLYTADPQAHPLFDNTTRPITGESETAHSGAHEPLLKSPGSLGTELLRSRPRLGTACARRAGIHRNPLVVHRFAHRGGG